MYCMSVPPRHTCEWGLSSAIRNGAAVCPMILNVLVFLDSTMV